jgi:hypothetical protein
MGSKLQRDGHLQTVKGEVLPPFQSRQEVVIADRKKV